MSIRDDAEALNGVTVTYGHSASGGDSPYYSVYALYPTSHGTTTIVNGQTVYSGQVSPEYPIPPDGTFTVSDFDTGAFIFTPTIPSPGVYGASQGIILGTTTEGGIVLGSPSINQPAYVVYFPYVPAIGSSYDSRNPAPLQTACFAAGTLIATPQGERSVESLAAGETVTLAGGGTSRIIWTGCSTIQCNEHPRPLDVLPILIEPDALAPGVPSRPLRVSPGHGLAMTCVDQILVPAEKLVTGSTIRREHVETVTYYHIELEAHAVLLADSAPAESYLDVGNRHLLRSDNVIPIAPVNSNETNVEGCLPEVAPKMT